MKIKINTPETFWARVNKTRGCWLWTGGTQVGGYGSLGYRGRHITAHRLAYELMVGPIPDGMSLCHKCDTPSCVNPDHLFVGTMADNINDMWKKNRGASGERQGHSKLTLEQVRWVRENKTLTNAALAAMFNVHRSTVSRIRNGLRWGRHI